MNDQISSQRPVGAFSPAVVIGLVLVGIFSFAAFILLSAFEPELASGSNGGAQALSQSAVGYAGLVRLLQEMGAPVHVGRTTGDLARREGLVIATPEQPLTWSELQAAGGATTLMVLPKWQTAPDRNHRGWVARVQPASPDEVARLITDIAPGLTVSRETGVDHPSLVAPDKTTIQAGRIDQLQTIAGDALAPVITNSGGQIVLARLRRNRQQTNVYILADPDLLNTQGIADINNAAAALAMIGLIHDEARQPIVFDVTLNGLGSARSALRLAFQPPFLGFTLGFAIAGALLAWRAALRFGPNAPTQRAIALGKAALAENSAALIRLSGRERRLAPGYARMTAGVASDKLGLKRQDEAQAAAALDRIGAAQGIGESYSRLAAAAAAAKSSQQMLEAARKLYAWKKEIARATR
ncbi:MAG: hypothetical protein HY054_08940 [Proteobacteria bacterium]|nr:hypothetical protein [Pseudomonadota bacterium]